MERDPSLALVKGLLQLCMHCGAPASPAAHTAGAVLSHCLRVHPCL